MAREAKKVNFGKFSQVYTEAISRVNDGNWVLRGDINLITDITYH